jgi:hypothetical protein
MAISAEEVGYLCDVHLGGPETAQAKSSGNFLLVERVAQQLLVLRIVRHQNDPEVLEGLLSRVVPPEVLDLLLVYSAQNKTLKFCVFYLLAERLGVLHVSKIFSLFGIFFDAVIHTV